MDTLDVNFVLAHFLLTVSAPQNTKKATALWGEFTLPKRGPFVEPVGSAMDRPTAEERAITPDGFARAFFEANP